MAGKSALTSALAGGGGDAARAPPPDLGRVRLDPKAFPCLAGQASNGGSGGAAPAGADGDAVGALVGGFERVSLRGDQLAGSAPTAGLLPDGSAAVRYRGGRTTERDADRSFLSRVRGPHWCALAALALLSHTPSDPTSHLTQQYRPTTSSIHTGAVAAKNACHGPVRWW